MDSGQLMEPDPPEPPDPPSSPVRTSNRSFSPVKALILCKSHSINGVSFLDRSIFSKRLSISSFHLLLLSSASESFMTPNLNMKFSQISVYSAFGVLWLSISSLILVLRSSFSPGGWFVGAWFGFVQWPYYCGMQSLFMGFVVSRRSHCMFYLTACQSGCSFVHGLLGPHHHLMLHSSPNNPGCISEIFKLIHWCCVDCFGVVSWSVPNLGAAIYCT
uniref:Uncharacterized protein n=1 Tax=Brassica oleracea TaxID=3712 RepID=A0A3P6FEW8_BRAOL|nr:unnamed protein product [Brassica oleracea]